MKSKREMFAFLFILSLGRRRTKSSALKRNSSLQLNTFQKFIQVSYHLGCGTKPRAGQISGMASPSQKYLETCTSYKALLCASRIQETFPPVFNCAETTAGMLFANQCWTPPDQAHVDKLEENIRMCNKGEMERSNEIAGELKSTGRAE